MFGWQVGWVRGLHELCLDFLTEEPLAYARGSEATRDNTRCNEAPRRAEARRQGGSPDPTCEAFLAIEAVAHPPDADQILWRGGIVFYLLAQRDNVVVHDAVGDVHTGPPHLI